VGCATARCVEILSRQKAVFIWPLRSKAAHVSSWHLDMPRQPDDVRSPGAKQTFRRKAATSVFDPLETSAMLPRNKNWVLRAEFLIGNNSAILS
jgi:hypothetical protein